MKDALCLAVLLDCRPKARAVKQQELVRSGIALGATDTVDAAKRAIMHIAERIQHEGKTSRQVGQALCNGLLVFLQVCAQSWSKESQLAVQSSNHCIAASHLYIWELLESVRTAWLQIVSLCACDAQVMFCRHIQRTAAQATATPQWSGGSLKSSPSASCAVFPCVYYAQGQQLWVACACGLLRVPH